METAESTSSMKQQQQQQQVLDGSNIMKLVGNEEVFSSFVDHKFQELDRDRDGQLSVKELQPAVADIGAALGLPAQGSSPDSDHIYSEVLNEFTHGKQEKVSKIEFREVLSDILLGMAAGLKRDPIVILRMDGEDLEEFINGPSYEPEMASIFSQIESPDGSMRDFIIKALDKLTVEQGMPPSSDSWVMSNIVEPGIQSCAIDEHGKPVSQETFLVEFKKIADCVAQRLKEQPVIVAHSENTFDGSGIKRLLSNKFELDKTMTAALENVPKDRNGKLSKDYLRVALDAVAASAGLPPIGAVALMDVVVSEAFKMVNADDGKLVKGMVRGRLTVQTEKSPRQYRGIFHALTTVLREEGPRSLYKGWLPSVIGVIPYVGLNFAVYESLKDWLIKSKALGLVDDNNELGVATRLACGAAAGTVGQTVAYPLDVIRRRMQMAGWKDAASVVTGDGKAKAALEYNGMVDAFRKTVRHEGFGALYKGLVPNSVKVVPSIAIAFVTYEMVKDILGVEMRISD